MASLTSTRLHEGRSLSSKNSLPMSAADAQRHLLSRLWDVIYRCKFLLLPALGFLYFSRTPVKREAPAGVCDPFAKPGALYLNLVNATSTIWTPFDETCRPSHLLPLVKQVLDADAMCVMSFTVQLFLTRRCRSDKRRALPWLADKTM